MLYKYTVFPVGKQPCGGAATGSCLIKQDSASIVGTPTTDGDSETTYSCVASDNCNYEVHVIGNYESSNGRHGFFTDRVAGDTDVIVSVSGESPRPLIIVLTSYEPVRWRLSVTSGVIIDRVILSGYYASTVTSSPSNAIRQTETLRDPDNHYGYGTDLGSGGTAELLLYLQQRFGPVTSFSGSYRADRWELNIHRTSGCSFNNVTRNCPVPSAPENGEVNVTGVQPIVTKYSCHEGALVGPQMRTSHIGSCLIEKSSDSSGVIIDRVILSGYYASTVTSSRSNAIRQTETLRDPDNHYGYGTDLGGGGTGPVTSFSGSYRADRWELNIHRTSGCSFNNMIRNCPVPSAPENGAANVTGVQPIVAKYSCHEGTLVGPEIRTCLESGWSGEEPSCRTGFVCTATAIRDCAGPSNYCGSLPSPSDIYGYADLTCEENHCRCSAMEHYDYCTCLPHIGSCLIEKDSENRVGDPTSVGIPETTYSCVAFDNCQYDVHVIGNYESSNGRHGFFSSSSRTSSDIYEPVRWRLSVTSGVTIDRVILSSYYNSTVSSSTASAIRHTEILSRSEGIRGYGSDIGGGKTADLLLYLQERFGPVTSFSGSYRASRWDLNIKRRAECGWASTACENLSPPANRRVDISSLEPETTVRYTCNVGFQLSGNRVRTCLESGLWSGQAPSCIVQSCSSLSPPPNGNVEFPDTTVSSISTYTCHVGFTLAGNARRKCIGAGKWSGEAPNCTKHSCPPLSPPSNGKVMFSDTRPFSSTTYTCDVGFQLIGSARRICTRALTWSEEDPICIKLRCPTLLPPSNGHVSLVELGPLQASYTCDSVLLASLYALVNSLEGGRENLQSVLPLCRILHLPNQTPQLQVLPVVLA
ncbi:Sushi, von Willebrand factor type A, EGF and pentraxin domain-containing protein 1 [Geodia barretti]|uniref:Sushi, von Willebrand factor type A, EGF and pentraxin domain-containing protein 1 n=1 Tax=Geodia barretti TaxID=519541 RepID=A0AA35T831_GEOBA|nr:Sushi, von Willebrand factor type A, EGF and pentraxin domain-containing protein 1 [Geodia barretti]